MTLGLNIHKAQVSSKHTEYILISVFYSSLPVYSEGNKENTRISTSDVECRLFFVIGGDWFTAKPHMTSTNSMNQ